MAKKETNASRDKTKGRQVAKQVKSEARIPASIRRAIEAHAREWLAPQKQEAELAQKLAAQAENDRIQRDASIAKVYDIEAELQQLTLWRAECRKRRTRSLPRTQESGS